MDSYRSPPVHSLTVGGSGLIAVPGFGLSLANLPGINQRMVDVALDSNASAAGHHVQILNFHSDLAFLVRTFFFVLLGVVVQFQSTEGRLIITSGALGALFLARVMTLLATYPAWRKMARVERELLLWIMPRGLITAVLAVSVYEARPAELRFLPGLAFAIILLTNLMMVFGAIRAKRASSAESPAP